MLSLIHGTLFGLVATHFVWRGAWLSTSWRSASSYCRIVRAVPEIILGAAFFFRPLHLQDTHGVGAPRPPGHVSALINPAPLWIKYALTPRTSYPPPLGHFVNKTPSPHRTKKCLRPTHPRIISRTALIHRGRSDRGQRGVENVLIRDSLVYVIEPAVGGEWLGHRWFGNLKSTV